MNKQVMTTALIALASVCLGAYLGAYLGSYFTIKEQRQLYKDHAVAMQEVIRYQVTVNIATLRQSNAALRAHAPGATGPDRRADCRAAHSSTSQVQSAVETAWLPGRNFVS